MKTLLKNVLIPPLSSHLTSSMANYIFGRGTPIFLLHRIATSSSDTNILTTDHLRRCLQYLLDNNYTFISLEEQILAIIEKRPLPKNSVIFTMDDGYLDQAEIAAPIFLEFKCPLTFFVISEFLDKKIWPWDAQAAWIIDNTEKTELNLNFSDEHLHIKIYDKSNRHKARELVRNYLKEVDATQIPSLLTQLEEAANLKLPNTPPTCFQAMSWQQARTLEEKGIRFAPHSTTHRIMSKLDRTTVEQEILESWQTLRLELKNPLNVFCYPTGRILDFGPREIEILKNNGFIGAVSTITGHVEPDKVSAKQLFSLPRFNLPNNMTDFIQYCGWIEYSKQILGRGRAT